MSTSATFRDRASSCCILERLWERPVLDSWAKTEIFKRGYWLPLMVDVI